MKVGAETVARWELVGLADLLLGPLNATIPRLRRINMTCKPAVGALKNR